MKIKEQYISYITIVRKEIYRFMRIWPQTFIPSIVTTSLYFIIFGKVIGQQIRHINGVDFIDFILPGLVMMSVIMNSYNNVVFSFFVEKFHHSIEEIMVSPTPNSVMLFGYITGGVVRGMLSGALILLVANFFTEVKIHDVRTMIVITIIASILFSIIGLINGIFAKSFDDISWIPSFVLTPLSYLGGIFYSVNDLPAFWKSASLFNPIFYFVDALRYSMVDISMLKVGATVVIALSLTVFFWFIAIYLLKNKLKQ